VLGVDEVAADTGNDGRLSAEGVTHPRRLAQVEECDGGNRARDIALLAAAKAYGDAEQMAAHGNLPQLFYPGLNGMAIELVLHARDAHCSFDAESSARVRRSLQAKHDVDPDFWSNAGLMDLDLYEALARRGLAGRLAALSAGYAELHSRVAGRTHWETVADQVSFVLSAHASRASSADGRAAGELKAQIDRYAQ